MTLEEHLTRIPMRQLKRLYTRIKQAQLQGRDVDEGLRLLDQEIRERNEAAAAGAERRERRGRL